MTASLQRMLQFAQTGPYRSIITDVEKSINSSDQIPAEFGGIPDKREGGAESAPPPGSIRVNAF